MCEPPQQITTPHPPSTRFQFHPTTPEKPTRYSPNSISLNNNCFKCQQPGHWASVCPLKSPGSKSHFHSSASASKQIQCRCGHGFCDVKISYSDKNYDRRYFVCPIKRGARCSTFVKWCDDPINETDLQPPLVKYPECECGAGVCRKVMETEEGSRRVKSYFVCPIKQSHGSCGFRVWEDEVLNTASIDELVNNPSITPVNDDLVNDLADGSDLLLTTKRMGITDSSENPSPVTGSEILEGKSRGSSIEEASSQDIGFPEIEFEDDLESINLASWAAIEGEAFLSSRMSTPSRISSRQSLFQSDILASDASLGTIFICGNYLDLIAGSYPMGWLGRLIFFHPTQSLKSPQPKPFFCCISSSPDPIEVPKQTSTLNSQSECCNDLAIKTPNQCIQLSTDVVSPNRSQGSDSQVKARRQREIDESMKNSPTLEEHSKFLDEEKARLANIKDEHKKTEALLGESNQKRNLLSEDIARLEATVLEKQNELKICELETLKVETQLDDLKRRMLEVDVTVKDKVRLAEAARKQIAERDRKQIEAMTALEKAKHELVN